MEGTIMKMDKENVTPGIKKCSRCRVKRTHESVELLAKYSTCLSCRSKRKVVKQLQETRLPGVYVDYESYLDRLKFNVTEDIHELRLRTQAPVETFPRPENDAEISNETYQEYAQRLNEKYIKPIGAATGYRFAVRDYHKGGRKTKKIAFMFICSQDKGRQRKSRSNLERNVNNKLKTEYCGSRLSLTYTMNDGMVNIVFSHKFHEPLASNTRYKNALRVTQHSPNDLITQLPPIQALGRPLDYNLGSVAQYNTQVQLSQMVTNDQKDEVFSAEPFAEKTAEAIVAMAASAQQQQYKNKISVENIDKELIGLNE